MKYRFLLIILSFFLGIQCIVGQADQSKRANHWFFGENCGIDFSSGVPTSTLDGQINTLEGCSTISDTSGNLIFYTDGISVWNAMHQQMPNGNGLHGDWSSINSALIVPQPLSEDLYYIFTTPANGGHNSGFMSFEYAKVDMTLQDGLGDVVEKGNELFSISTEQLGGVQHCNGQDYWVLAHQDNSSNFMAYLIDESGLDTTPVISDIGIFIPPYSSACWSCYVADLEISPTGNKVAVTYSIKDTLELFDFDSSTGELSNPISINIEDPFGICFSPDGTKLYLNHKFNSTYALTQFDANSTTADQFINSGLIITNEASSSTIMQIGPDAKIYTTDGDWEYLSVINFPNQNGVNVFYQHDEIYLGGQRRYYGLPNFIQSYFVEDVEATDCFSTSVLQPDLQKSLTVFPNPCSAQEEIYISNNDFKELSVFIYSTEGRLLYQLENTLQTIISLSNISLENGIYILQIRDNDKLLHSDKLIIMD